MFAPSYFPGSFFSPVYFGTGGGTPEPNGGVYFAASYFGPSFFSPGYFGAVAPEPEPEPEPGPGDYFTRSYFTASYFSPGYFGPVDELPEPPQPTQGDYFPRSYFAATYFATGYFGPEGEPEPEPPGTGQVTGLRVYRDVNELVVEWDSTEPSGTPFQVYLNGRRVRTTTSRIVHLPWPQSRVTIDVIAVGLSQGAIDFSDSLPSAASNRVLLRWSGGAYLGSDIAGFHIYASEAPGGPVDYDAILATVPAYLGGIYTDGEGFGEDGFDEGGFGSTPGDYSWRSEPLTSGIWTFGVKAFDTAGNEGPAVETSETISGPPQAPAADPSGVRLSYVYSAATGVATLTWLASPG